MLDDRYGTCGCDRPECITARAVRRAAADACQTAIVAEYGSTKHDSTDWHLALFPAREWVCRAFPWRSVRPCPSCKFVPRPAPAWAVHGAVFGLDGAAYRIVSVGSSGRRSPNGLHSEAFIITEPVSSEKWSLPELPATCNDVAQALHVLFNDLPRFWIPDLERALWITPPAPEPPFAPPGS